MQFLVESELNVAGGTPEAEVTERVSAEASASAQLARDGRLQRLWRPPVVPGEVKAIGLYRAESQPEKDGLPGALRLSPWMQIEVTRSAPHSTDNAQ